MAISYNATYPYISRIHEILPGRILKLNGYSNGNKSYGEAKKPNRQWRNSPSLTEQEIINWLCMGGWIGVVIPKGSIVVDIDERTQGQLVKELLEGENVHHHCIKTPNGWQFVFKAEQQATKKIKQITKYFTQVGVVIDTRTPDAGYIVFPTENTEGRYIATKSYTQPDELPHFLRPVRNSKTVKDKVTGEKYNFPVPIEEAGSRNDTLYKFAAYLKAWKVSPIGLEKAMELIYKYCLLDKSEFPLNELKNLTKSAIQWKPEPSKFELQIDQYGARLETPEGTVIPLPFQIQENALFKTIVKKVDGLQVEQSIMVSRLAPMILRELSNIERNSIHYELAWRDRGRERREVVPASTISTKKELMGLSDSGLPVNDLNYKEIISFFDKFLALNRLEQARMVERLGKVQDIFIHPLVSQGIEIVPNDFGERQLLEAFQSSGTVETWITEVLEQIKKFPKVLFMVLASFASVLLYDLKVSPFIIDLSGSTSQGKTTALHVARSVWGSEGLINEWNVTKVALERKAGFLNSFPLYMDDTRKAD